MGEGRKWAEFPQEVGGVSNGVHSGLSEGRGQVRCTWLKEHTGRLEGGWRELKGYRENNTAMISRSVLLGL